MNRNDTYSTVRFGDVAREVTESTHTPLEDGFERYIGLEHLDSESLKIRRWGLIEENATTFTRVFRAGQVLFGRRRAYQRKAALADFDGICSGDIIVMEAKPGKLLPELLPFIVQTEGFYEHALSTSAGSLSPRTKWSALAKYEFPLPPLDEQRRIAEILWAVEDAIGSYRDALTNLSRTRQLVTNTVFCNGLDNSNTIKTPWGTMPVDWQLVSMEELAVKDAPIRYGIVQVGLGTPNGVPTIAIKDLQTDYTDLHLTDQQIEGNYAGSRVQSGDILISVKGTVGRIDLVPKGFEGNISRDIARIRVNGFVSPHYLVYFLRSQVYQRYLQRVCVGTTRMELSIHLLKKLTVPVPSLTDQTSIVQMIRSFDTASICLTSHISSLSYVKRTLLNDSSPNQQNV